MATIFTDIKFVKLLEEIAPQKGSDTEKTFTTIAQACCFAAALAFNEGKKLDMKIKIKRGSEVRDNVLDNKAYKQQIDLLAMAVTGSHEILQDNEDNKNKRYEIFQNFAHQGLELLTKYKANNPTDVTGIDTVINILQEQSSKNVKSLANSELGDPDF